MKIKNIEFVQTLKNFLSVLLVFKINACHQQNYFFNILNNRINNWIPLKL